MLPANLTGDNPASTDVILVGRVGSTYGLKGWVKIISFTAPRHGILDYQPWLFYIDKVWQPKRIVAGRPQGKGLVVQFENCFKPEDTKLLINIDIGIMQQQLPSLPEGEYYWAELIGLRVINTTNVELGIIDHLFETGANDVIVLKAEKPVLIPYISTVVLTVDLPNSLMRVDWE